MLKACIVISLLTGSLILATQEKEIFHTKDQQLRLLLKKGLAHFNKFSLGKVCRDFAKDPAWRLGDLFLFIVDQKGTCYCFDNEAQHIWKSFGNLKDVLGVSVQDRLFSDPKQKSIFNIDFNNARLHIHSAVVKKGGRSYALGSAFYPESAHYIAVDFVNQAIDAIQKIGIHQTSNAINNPSGPFVHGGMFTFIIDEDGLMLANGGNGAFIGLNVFAPADIIGDPVVTKHMKEFFESDDTSRWIKGEYFNNIMNAIYAVKYTDPKADKTYMVASIYYPTVNEDVLYTFVQKAIAYIKTVGKKEALKAFNDPHGNFALAGMRIGAYTLDGLCLAHGEDLSFINQNVISRRDQTGGLPFKALIENAAQFDRAWTSTRQKNSYKLVFSEKIDLPSGPIIIAGGYWPHSKRHTVKGIVERAAGHLKQVGKERALQAFLETDPAFLRGDTTIAVLDTKGIFQAAGYYHKNKIWLPMKIKDQHGRPVIQKILSIASQGGGWTTYQQFNQPYNVYVQQLEVTNSGGGKEELILFAGYYEWPKES